MFSESKNLLELARDNKDSHFFLDEVHMSQNQVSSKVIAEISSLISQDNFLWVACQSDRLPTKTDSNLKGKIITICFILCHAFKCFIYQNMLCIVFEQINKMKLKLFFLLLSSFGSALVDLPCIVSGIGSILSFFHSHLHSIYLQLLCM